MNFVAAFIRPIDRLLRLTQHIEEFSAGSECLFRISHGRSPVALSAQRATIPAGAPVLVLHYWNEHFGRLASTPGNLSWGAKARRQVVTSLVQLTEYVERQPGCRDIAGIVATVTFVSAGQARVGARILARLGFCSAPWQSTHGAVRTFFDQWYVALLRGAFAAASAHREPLARACTLRIWISRDALLERFGASRGQVHGASREAVMQG